MSIGAVFVGDEGTRILLNAGTNISASTVRRIRYEKPDGTTGFWSANLDSGLEKLYYDTQTDDLDISGTWKLQNYVEMPTWTGTGEIAQLKIYDPISIT
jgi:hypothetical protein